MLTLRLVMLLIHNKFLDTLETQSQLLSLNICQIIFWCVRLHQRHTNKLLCFFIVNKTKQENQMLVVVVCSLLAPRMCFNKGQSDLAETSSGDVDRTVHVQHVAERHLHCSKLRMET